MKQAQANPSVAVVFEDLQARAGNAVVSKDDALLLLPEAKKGNIGHRGITWHAPRAQRALPNQKCAESGSIIRPRVIENFCLLRCPEVMTASPQQGSRSCYT